MACMKIDVCKFLLLAIMDLILNYVEMSRIYQIGRVSHHPNFNWIETWNHTTWLHDE